MSRLWQDSLAARRRMVERQMAARGIHDGNVLAAASRLRRELFVPESAIDRAYEDAPLPIGYGQTISQPFMAALMAQTLRLTGRERVLEIGAGSGYHAALLSHLAAEVWSVEIVPELAETARANLRRAAIHNVTVIAGDGSAGYPPAAPYDAISVAAGAPAVPRALLDQLADPGRLVIPVGGAEDQELLLLVKREGAIAQSREALCRFVPLTGEHGWRA